MRDIDCLVPVVREKLEALKARAEEKGIGFIVVQTLRTAAEELAYFAQGRKTLDEVNRLRADAGLGPITCEENEHIVTRVMTSIHEFGCAFDVAIVKDGRVDWNDIPAYKVAGAIGESLGLRWGGRFSFRDWGHFEYTGGLTLEELEKGKRPEV